MVEPEFPRAVFFPSLISKEVSYRSNKVFDRLLLCVNGSFEAVFDTETDFLDKSNSLFGGDVLVSCLGDYYGGNHCVSKVRELERFHVFLHVFLWEKHHKT